MQVGSWISTVAPWGAVATTGLGEGFMEHGPLDRTLGDLGCQWEHSGGLLPPPPCTRTPASP